jgi:hypothetical protein
MEKGKNVVDLENDIALPFDIIENNFDKYV